MHFVDEKDSSKALKVLKKCLNYDCRFVVFQNKGKHKVVNSNTTYLNVLAEGIVSLYIALLSEDKNFELNINIATRKNTDKNYGIISDEEYILRLKERMTLEFLRKSIYRPENKRWIDEKNINLEMLDMIVYFNYQIVYVIHSLLKSPVNLLKNKN